jgi:hypothetical protein
MKIVAEGGKAEGQSVGVWVLIISSLGCANSSLRGEGIDTVDSGALFENREDVGALMNGLVTVFFAWVYASDSSIT